MGTTQEILSLVVLSLLSIVWIVVSLSLLGISVVLLPVGVYSILLSLFQAIGLSEMAAVWMARIPALVTSVFLLRIMITPCMDWTGEYLRKARYGLGL